MEGKRGLFALPGNGSGTNRLDGMAEPTGSSSSSSDRNRLDGEHGGGPSVNICLLPGRGRWTQGRVIYPLKN